MNSELLRSLRYNTLVNLLDGAFFGFGMGFASFVTVLPLFVSTMTDSPLLIGLIPAIHAAGWQLPQLFLAGWVSLQRRFKPHVVRLSSLERLPYLGYGIIAFLLPTIGIQTGLILTFGMLVMQGLGAGVTANPWQSMIAKIIPGERRGTFFGVQAGLANMLASLGAVFSGLILGNIAGPHGFGWSFMAASVLLAVSWYFLSLTREPANPPTDPQRAAFVPNTFKNIGQILRQNGDFRWFLIARSFSQLAVIGYAFYTVYAVKHHGVSEVEIGVMTGVLMITQIIANVGMGWFGDRWGHRHVMEFGLISLVISSFLAWWAPAAGWFYLVFILAAFGNVAIWTVAISMTLEYGKEAERPTYIGMANTLIAPANILAPFLGGWLASSFGYPAAFLCSALGGLAAAGIFHFLVHDPKTESQEKLENIS